MADAKNPLQFLERGVGVVADVRRKLIRIELAPVAPTGLGGQVVRFGCGQVAIDGAFAQPKQPAAWARVPPPATNFTTRSRKSNV